MTSQPKGRRAARAFLAVALCAAVLAGIWYARGPRRGGPVMDAGGASEVDGAVHDASAAASLRAADAHVDAVATPGFSCPEGMVAYPSALFQNEIGRLVRVAGFCADEVPASVAAYRACVESGRCDDAGVGTIKVARNSEGLHYLETPTCNYRQAGRAKAPMNCIDLPQAKAYCNYRRARLPSQGEVRAIHRRRAELRGVEFQWPVDETVDGGVAGWTAPSDPESGYTDDVADHRFDYQGVFCVLNPRDAPPAPPPPPPPPVPQCPTGMAGVAAGEFMQSINGRSVRRVLGALCVDVNEVTVDSYRACVSKRQCKDEEVGKCHESVRTNYKACPGCNYAEASRSQHPMNCVSLHDANAFCKSRGERLPTDAEWVWAARGGSAALAHPWGNARRDLVDYECLPGRGALATCPVGSFVAGKSVLGMLDLEGNASEWTTTLREASDEYLTRASVSHYGHYSADARKTHLGFRCVMDAQTADSK